MTPYRVVIFDLRPERVAHELQALRQCPHAVIALAQQEVGGCEPQ